MIRLRVLCGWVVLANLSAHSLVAAEKEKTKAELEVERVVSAAREDSQVMDHLDVLSNRIGPRLTSSDGLQNACEWARDRFASFGIDNARLEEWGTFPVGFNRGPWTGKVVEPAEHALEFITMSWSAGTKGIVRGKAVLAPTDATQLETMKDGLAGSWVITPSPSRGGPKADPGFIKTLKAAYAKVGIAGIVKSGRGELIVTAGNHKVAWDKLPTIPEVVLVQKQFDEIAGWIKEGKPVTLEFDIRNYFKKGPIKLYNVIADIPGTEKPEEYVIVGGHIDSWDGATGTTDNGTGCATTLEAARVLMKAGVKPKRTIRFMLWSGEEQGLLGSEAYVKAHPELMPKISAVLVHDGGTNYLAGLGGTEAMQNDLKEAFTPVTTLDPKFPFEVGKVDGLSGGGSDHSSFLGANVPGFFWRQKGDAKYVHTHHTQFDTFDAAIPDYQKHSSVVIALGATGIANLDHLLSREKMRSPNRTNNRRMLGIVLDEMAVTEVVDNSVAAKAGIKEGDMIIKVDGNKVEDRTELSAALRPKPDDPKDTKKTVTVNREGKELDLTADFAPPPQPEVPASTNPAPAKP